MPTTFLQAGKSHTHLICVRHYRAIGTPHSFAYTTNVGLHTISVLSNLQNTPIGATMIKTLISNIHYYLFRLHVILYGRLLPFNYTPPGFSKSHLKDMCHTLFYMFVFLKAAPLHCIYFIFWYPTWIRYVYIEFTKVAFDYLCDRSWNVSLLHYETHPVGKNVSYDKMVIYISCIIMRRMYIWIKLHFISKYN